MEIYHHHDLSSYNSFNIKATAKHFVSLETRDDIFSFTQKQWDQPVMVLGGGSNVLFVNDFDGTIAYIGTHGKRIVKEDSSSVYLEVEAGENWDDVVAWCVGKGYGGIENLSGIPGNAGTSPIQNIGAYGVELKEVFYALKAVDLQTGEALEMLASDLHFGYRDSIFKHRLKGKYIIMSIVLKLSKKPLLNLSYGALAETVSTLTSSPGIEEIRKAVLAIRSSKLPDPDKLGNAGSFFKNPLISYKHYVLLKASEPGLVAYEQPGKLYKVAAGWLIDRCGYKGHRSGDAGVHHKQALVLVNHGRASGKEIVALAMEIREAVKKRFNILLEPEVNIIQ